MDSQLGSEPETTTIFVPLVIPRRGGRKLVLAPDGEPAQPWHRVQADNAMIKALARAHRWRSLLESGAYASITELATAEKVNSSYVSRILRLTLLAPDITEAILNGRQPRSCFFACLLRPFPLDWEEQRLVVLGR